MSDELENWESIGADVQHLEVPGLADEIQGSEKMPVDSQDEPIGNKKRPLDDSADEAKTFKKMKGSDATELEDSEKTDKTVAKVKFCKFIRKFLEFSLNFY
jgi:hypothetical protein